MSLSACSFAGLEPFSDDGAVRATSQTVGLSPKAGTQAPGFVEASRRNDLGYVPVGVTPPARTPLSNRQQVEADLNAKRAANEARAAVPRPASPYDGRVEPGYKPPPLPPIPGEPAPTPAAAKAKPKPKTSAPRD